MFDYSTDTLSKMTEENCNDNYWTADKELEKPQSKRELLVSFLRSLLKWLKTLFETLTEKAKLGRAGA